MNTCEDRKWFWAILGAISRKNIQENSHARSNFGALKHLSGLLFFFCFFLGALAHLNGLYQASGAPDLTSSIIVTGVCLMIIWQGVNYMFTFEYKALSNCVASACPRS